MTTKNVSIAMPVLINWHSSGNSGVPTLDANHTAIIHQENMAVIEGHKYLVSVTAAGFVNYEANRTCRYTLAVGSNNNWLCIQEFGMHRNGFTGFGTAPVSLHGIYTAPANSTVTVFFGFWSENASWGDWTLNQNNHHHMFALDLGP